MTFDVYGANPRHLGLRLRYYIFGASVLLKRSAERRSSSPVRAGEERQSKACLGQTSGQKFNGSDRLRSVSDPVGPVRRYSLGASLYTSCLTAASSRRMENLRLVRPWLSLRTLEGGQGEFLCSRICSFRWVSETLSHRILHPPMLIIWCCCM